MTAETASVARAQEPPPLHVVVLGSGTLTPLLVLHGWGQTLEIMRPLGTRLANQRPVHLIDLPGFGQSPWPGADWGTYEYAQRLIAYLDERGLDQISVLGHSFGGRIGLQLASHWPARIHTLVLVASAGLPPRRTRAKRIRIGAVRTLGRLLALVPGSAGESLRGWHRTRFGSRDYRNAGVLRKTFIKTVTEDQTDNASAIRQPTLLLWGERDTETPVDMAERLHQLIADSSLVILPGRDHYPFAGSDVHACAEIVNEFLSKQDRTNR